MNLHDQMQRLADAVDNLEAVDVDSMPIYEQREYIEALADLRQKLFDTTRVLAKPILDEIEPPVVDIIRDDLRPTELASSFVSPKNFRSASLLVETRTAGQAQRFRGGGATRAQRGSLGTGP